ncbi:WYL domain-containing protein [Paenibacillus sp. N4]|uniref:WYL domain-containing protein n=1 Tax=Paenibacillus vietnamensis TaxID=2590547 RepID=UPI001CD17000|nr:WYL domain-containing protein [Paenibacillus vietnamensis]MCA0757089.1 WYL domain-containing protein [Paenibacillus vietnamensis]
MEEPGGKSEEENTVRLVLRFAKEAEQAAAEHFDREEMERLADGTLMIKAVFPDGTWLIGFLLRFHTGMLVLEPARLAAAVRETALEIAAMYTEAGDEARREGGS